MKPPGLPDLLAPYAGSGEPGHVVGIYRGGELVDHASAGRAVLEHDIPAGVDTVFDIASASKQFTATCLVLLARDGMLRLADDVRGHLPELRLTEPVTLRQCLTHTGGLREYFALCELGGVPTAGLDETRVLRLLAGQRDLNFPPGTNWSYSNSGFVLAAATVRRLTGRSLAQFAAERLFGPLGMTVTRFRDDLPVPVPGLATGYTPAPGGGWHRVDISEETVGDGAIITSIADLAKWQGFLLTGAVLGTDVRDALLGPATLADGRPLPYALGLEITTVGASRLYLHSGHIGGFRSALAYLIEEGMGIAVLANRDDTFPAELAVRIAERLLGVDPPPPPVRLAPDAARAAQPAVAGRWYSPESGVHLDITAADDGTVTEQVPGGSPERYQAVADGGWRGVGCASSMRLTPAGRELRREEVVGDEPAEIFVRVSAPPALPPPAGTYYSDELRTYATLAPAPGRPGGQAPGAGDGAGGAVTVTIGIAPPRTLSPAAEGTWAGDGLTLRPLPGAAALEVSLFGASRCRFTLAGGPAPDPQLGL